MSYGRRLAAVLPCLFFILLTVNCGGGGGSSSSDDSGGGDTDVTGLEVAEQVSLVTADDSANASLSSFLRFGAVDNLPVDSDFFADAALVSLYVANDAFEMLDIINEVMCELDQTQYDFLVNQGTYGALVDVGRCEGRGGDHSSDQGNESTGSNSQDFELWVINSSRVNNSSPHIVQFWIHGDDSGEDPFNEIRAEMTITEGKSDVHPMGLFSMNFVGLFDGFPSMTGNMSSVENADGNNEFEMKIDGGAWFQEETHAIISLDGATGQAYGYHNDAFYSGADGNSENTIHIAFDSENFRSKIDADDTCWARNEFDTRVWEYNLYHGTTGERASRNSGMSIKSEDGEWGWVGPYGVWLGEEGPENGQIVTKADDDSVQYTVFVAPGILVKNTKESHILGDFIDAELIMWDNDLQVSVLAKWTGSQLIKTAIQECTENSGCEFIPIAEAVVSTEANQWLSFWWENGGGGLEMIVPQDNILQNDVTVTSYLREQVLPGSDDLAGDVLTFKCYFDCLRGGLTQANIDNEDFFHPNIEEENGVPYIYTFDKINYALIQNGQAVTLPEGADFSATSHYWGFVTGAMMLSSVANLQYPWEVWQQDVSYYWETGTNPWNKMSGIVDVDGVYQIFDPELPCDGEDEDGNAVRVWYAGERNLHLPWEEDENGNWYPAFGFMDGTELSCEGETYVTRAMSMQQNLRERSSNACASLSFGNIGAPSVVPQDPGLDEAPAIGAPAVVGGVLQ